MKRGDVFCADLEPIAGAEANRTRPVVLVGNNASLGAADRFQRGVVTVVPMTRNLSVRGPMHVVVEANGLNGLRETSKMQVEQIRAIDISRLRTRLGKLGANNAAELNTALRHHFSLS